MLSQFSLFSKKKSSNETSPTRFICRLYVHYCVFVNNARDHCVFSLTRKTKTHKQQVINGPFYLPCLPSFFPCFASVPPALTAAGLGVLPAGSSRWSLPAGPGLAPPQPVSIRQEGKPRYRPACAPHAPSRGRAAWMDG